MEAPAKPVAAKQRVAAARSSSRVVTWSRFLRSFILFVRSYYSLNERTNIWHFENSDVRAKAGGRMSARLSIQILNGSVLRGNIALTSSHGHWGVFSKRS